MAKYGRGLNREIVGAVNRGLIQESFSIQDIKKFTLDNGWDIPETYINVCLANGASESHSLTYKKYFMPMGDGKYKLANDFAGKEWI